AKHKALVKMAETVAPKATVKMAAKMKAESKSISASNDAASSSEPDMVLLVILAFFIPPLAVYLYEGDWTKRCTVNLILSFLCFIPGIVHALIVILE
ncbi:MAG: YqaE/Pmp3 family membrane protein, partial [Flavobacteriales bacterium]